MLYLILSLELISRPPNNIPAQATNVEKRVMWSFFTGFQVVHLPLCGPRKSYAHMYLCNNSRQRSLGHQDSCNTSRTKKKKKK